MQRLCDKATIDRVPLDDVSYLSTNSTYKIPNDLAAPPTTRKFIIKQPGLINTSITCAVSLQYRWCLTSKKRPCHLLVHANCISTSQHSIALFQIPRFPWAFPHVRQYSLNIFFRLVKHLLWSLLCELTVWNMITFSSFVSLNFVALQKNQYKN